MILVDSSVLIDFFKNNDNYSIRKFKDVINQDIPFGITSHIFQEILQGAKSQSDYNKLKKYLESQVFYNPEDPVQSFAKAAQIYRKCRHGGITLRSTIDCIIAQVAIEKSLSLLHNDKDFDRIADVVKLKIY